MEIEIEDLYGNKFNLLVEPQTSVGNVKAKMQDKEGIPAELCDLFGKDRVNLEDSTILSDLEIESGSRFLFCLSHEKMKVRKAAEEKAEKDKKEAEEKVEKDKKEAEEKDRDKDHHRSGNPALVSFIYSITSCICKSKNSSNHRVFMLKKCDQRWRKSQAHIDFTNFLKV
jgi:hypothetical protein